MLTLMVERAGEVVATCAIQRKHETLAWLCYGLVDPRFHRQGIGTTMFVARLALLPAVGGPRQSVGISAVETSLSYYRQFGFRLLGRFDTEDGNRYPIALLEDLTSSLIEDCRAMLKAAGTTVPDLTDMIPFTPEENAAKTSEVSAR